MSASFDEWFYYQTDYSMCSSCNNLTRDSIQPEWPHGRSYCITCVRLAQAKVIALHDLNLGDKQ